MSVCESLSLSLSPSLSVFMYEDEGDTEAAGNNFSKLLPWSLYPNFK